MSTPNQRERAKAQTRAKVLAAARKLWAEPGTYETATMRDIARAAGMSTGAIFANWKSKEALWLEAMGYPAPCDCAEVRAAFQEADNSYRVVLDFIQWVEAFTGTLPVAQSDAMFDLYGRARRISVAVDPKGHDASRIDAMADAA